MSTILDVANVSKSFPSGGILSRNTVDAVVGADFQIEEDRPEIFTIVGESGSGKTTLARMILGLEAPSSGEVQFRGEPVSTSLGGRQRRAFMKAVQPVFQNPFEAFNPLKRVDRYIASTATAFRDLKGRKAVDEAMDEALVSVGLSLAEVRGRFPHELSGGQLQRAAIARALVCKPDLLVADEPVSMVDASLRMAIVNLLRSLRDDLGVSVIYITHDLATAYYISDRIIIMQKGRVVEMGPARAVLDDPQHPYSRLLKASVLSLDNPGGGDLTPARDLIAASDDVLARAGQSRLVDIGDGRRVRQYG
ncbi:ABC transporter ATP-binding protein [Wenxinia saemankumensis]|uniref:Peptide/nickel transport system ATP-binding protein n=1 Tax=Wenxinia saemankumensis TaxID=1447782 RepID=A0A1M6FLI9_9RHOB|nr:ABC transporter ATP-binding protein [Wenxinia saemankumensis]SHI98588.1 peptide/nickel transport system ATP-binding protein [Wenxinia saemankumensis]